MPWRGRGRAFRGTRRRWKWPPAGRFRGVGGVALHDGAPGQQRQDQEDDEQDQEGEE